MSSQNLSSQLDLASTFGALFIGVIGAALVFGTNSVQAFIYFQNNRETGATIYKLIVIWLWIFDALHLAFITYSVYYYLVSNYGNIGALTVLVWSFKLQVILDFFLIYGTHVLYAHRIWTFSNGRSRTPAIIVGIILIVTSGVGFVSIWVVYQSNTFSELMAKAWASYMALGTIACDDLIIASSLSYLLSTSRTGFSSTDSLLTKLMVYIINTGVLTSMTSMIAIITCATMPGSFTSNGVRFIMVKLYVASFLALMNASHYLQPKSSDNVELAEIRRHRPSSQTDNSGAEKSQGSRMNVFQHSHDCDDELYHTRPVQAVMRPIVMYIRKNSLSSA